MEIDLGSQQDGRIIYSDSNLRKCDNTKGEEKAREDHTGLDTAPCILVHSNNFRISTFHKVQELDISEI